LPVHIQPVDVLLPSVAGRRNRPYKEEDLRSCPALDARTGRPVVLLLGVAPRASSTFIPCCIGTTLGARDDVVPGRPQVLVRWIKVLPAVVAGIRLDQGRKQRTLHDRTNLVRSAAQTDPGFGSVRIGDVADRDSALLFEAVSGTFPLYGRCSFSHRKDSNGFTSCCQVVSERCLAPSPSAADRRRPARSHRRVLRHYCWSGDGPVRAGSSSALPARGW
jgi:hypothetical protein